MTAQDVLARIAENPKLPMPPTLTLRVLERASQPNCSIAEIAKLVSFDPALCGKMLRLVNSSLYGLGRPVTSIHRALNLLGLNHVRSLVLSLTLPTLRFQRATSEQMMAYWTSSATVAIVCRELAKRLKWPDSDSEMVTGLLCDLGELILQETFPDQYAAVNTALPDVRVMRQCELEERHIGVDHATTGAFFLRRWKLADELTEAIRHHHTPTAATAVLADRAYLLYFATRVSQLHQTVDQSVVLTEIVTLARDRFGMDDAGLQAFLDSLTPKIQEFAALIDVKLGPCEPFSDLFAKATENLSRLAVAASLDNLRVSEEKSLVEQGLKQATESLQKTEERLRQSQKMEAIGRLAGGIAHDFNNLLTVIIGMSEVVLDSATLSASDRGLVETVMSTGERAAELTHQLLAFSRKQLLNPKVIHLNQAVTNVTKMLRRLIGDDIQLVTRLSDDLELVKIDPSQIEQVIVNLAVNGRDAMPGGGTLTIETFNLQVDKPVAAHSSDIQPGAYVVISVRDTGCGIDDDQVRQIFEPFFTTKAPGKGTGLGLSTVHGIVRQSGGHILASSVVGQGTVFYVYLPVVHEPLALPKSAPVGVDRPLGKETILVVEDEDNVRKFTRQSLETFGYTVIEARNGIEALELDETCRQTIDLLLTDAVMPWMNGCELAQKLRTRRQGVRVLLISGYSDDSFLTNDAVAPTTPFLQKPFTAKALASKIREVLSLPALV